DLPRLILCVDAGALDAVDVQVFMTIGALREVYGFIERELNKLEQRRPDLAVLAQSPQSRAQLEQDPEVVAILSHPLALAQREEQMQQQMNRQGAQQIYGMFGVPMMGGMFQPPPPPWKIYRPYLS